MSDTPGPPASRVRVTSVAATLAAMAVAVSFFLPWVAVPGDEAEHFQAEMTRRLGDPSEPPPAGVRTEDWQRLADEAAEKGEVSGLDVFYWARTARATALAYEHAAVARALLLVAVVLASVHVAGVVVALALLVGRLHHAPSPVLILALLTGACAVAIPAAFSIPPPTGPPCNEPFGSPPEPGARLIASILLLPTGEAPEGRARGVQDTATQVHSESET